jgi:integration host factor subunit beta
VRVKEKKSTRVTIVNSMSNKTGIEPETVRYMVDWIIDEIKNALRERRIIELRGFGTFEIKIRKGRKKARNPKTGETISVDSHGVVSFRAGRELSKDIWNLPQDEEALHKEASKG